MLHIDTSHAIALAAAIVFMGMDDDGHIANWIFFAIGVLAFLYAVGA